MAAEMEDQGEGDLYEEESDIEEDEEEVEKLAMADVWRSADYQESSMSELY